MSERKSTLAIIPARYGSTRLPGKPLIKVRGKTIIQRVYERVVQAGQVDEVVVATDDVRIQNHVRKFGGLAVITRHDHPNGSSRCAEVAAMRSEFDYVLNIQGDEPLINPRQIDHLMEFIKEEKTREIATLVKKIDRADELDDSSVAKVVLAGDDRVLYFSRTAIPYVRNHPKNQWMDHFGFYKHVGIYAFKRNTLLSIGELQPSYLEHSEMLEQNNWLFHGYSVHAAITDIESIGIDTPDDLDLLEHILSLADR